MVPIFIHNDDPHARIIVTQPRRIAAIGLCRHVSTLVSSRSGGLVGYRIGGESCTSTKTRIEYVTTGYLVTLLCNNHNALDKYTHVIMDEVHERQLDADFLSLIIKLLLNNTKTKLVVMSATLQGDLFAKYFATLDPCVAPIIHVGHKRFPVKEIYLDNIEQVCCSKTSSNAKKLSEFFVGSSKPDVYFSKALRVVCNIITDLFQPGSCTLVSIVINNIICRYSYQELEK